jgi:UDP-GlcNAc:undecaprenyl-phosphate GlcNAc-1-phosphate transferase
MSTPIIFDERKGQHFATKKQIQLPVLLGIISSLVVPSYIYAVPSFIFSLILLGIFIQYADKLGFVDVPNFRSSHRKITPSSSGIALFLAITIGAFFTDISIYENHIMSILAMFLVLAVGTVDDLKGLRARHKIYIISIASLLCCWDGLVITDVGFFFGHTLSLMWLSIPLTIFSVVGFTNSFNLIDGLDGLAGTLSIIILSSLWYIGYQNNDHLLMAVAILVIPALFAFLAYNWCPAKAFMGDSGSLTLGFIISILSIRALDYVSPIVILYLVAVPIIDTIVIVTRRKKYGRPIFSPDKNHAHHICLNLFKGNVKKTVIVIGLIQLVYTLLGILFVTTLAQEITLPFLILNMITWYFILTKRCENNLKSMIRTQ